MGMEQIITTDGNVEHGKSSDVRINPNSQVKTVIEDMSKFYAANQANYQGAIWTYGRIDWEQLAR